MIAHYFPFLSIVFSLFDSYHFFDPNGYIAYCPCMGRFGNQADHFLGALGFAKGLNRTLILPPWVEYRFGEPKSVQVPFNTYFRVEPLEKFHKVILMEEFMKNVAPVIWPEEKRYAFCYMSRGTSNSCNPKEGNPFGPFWDTFNIDFVDSIFYGPLHYDVHHSHSEMALKWRQTYPSDKYPVLAFVGAPASFPVQEENKVLQKYLVWNDKVANEASNFIAANLPKGSFIAIHLRNGLDWVRACEHIKTSPSLFAAPQCLGYRGEGGKATREMCFPDIKLITKQVKRIARGMEHLVGLIVASDTNHMVPELSKVLTKMGVKVVKAEGSTPHVELAIMAKANQFIANCISSFSAFAVRERTSKGLPSHFWGYPPSIKSIQSNHDEL
ncbi:GDP-fucose protein O-fucosyltransferase 1 [Cimex lectularius]|uniref:GDP-fucose protein O-fucosyltransferase 1 n=1 Tax=Cimex lectularius TaxID=79782 RepID=A0A8I6S704_CIMLE|nr:GDP-fucose protein O-fucosyltransferase 1 [Cimex lectularius]